MDEVLRWIERLEAGADCYSCNGYLANMDSLHRYKIYTDLVYERLLRKFNHTKTYDEGNIIASWDDIFYSLFMRYMGVPANGEAFETLAKHVPYKRISQYAHNQQTLEALLIGGSGLLDTYYDDEYTLNLKREFAYLAGKHGIRKMSPSQWKISGIYPHNNPVLRMAQIAAFYAGGNFDVKKDILNLRTPEDVERKFRVEASEYWFEHFIPATKSSYIPKRIGRDKADILAINAVVLVQFSFSSFFDIEEYRDRALSLLEATAPEKNYKVQRWTSAGLKVQSAFDTQALIQLGDEYCNKVRCRECPVGRRIIKSVEESCKLKENT